MMKVKVGCDIVEIKRFNKLDSKTLNKIFHKNELKNLKSESLAGLFAAKESCKKVFDDLDWHDIEIKKKRNSKPFLILKKDRDVLNYDLSISYDGEYAIATVVFLTKKP
jgi:phosphopantetheine--protein transferase-like protein